jgi:hypothetical protein
MRQKPDFFGKFGFLGSIEQLCFDEMIDGTITA